MMKQPQGDWPQIFVHRNQGFNSLPFYLKAIPDPAFKSIKKEMSVFITKFLFVRECLKIRSGILWEVFAF
jgi:hypothetical protein